MKDNFQIYKNRILNCKIQDQNRYKDNFIRLYKKYRYFYDDEYFLILYTCINDHKIGFGQLIVCMDEDR